MPPDELPTEIIPVEQQSGYYDRLAPPDDYYDDGDYEDGYDEEYQDEYAEDDFADDVPDADRAAPAYIDPPDDEDDLAPPRRRGRPLKWLAALAVIALIGGGAWYGIDKIFGYPDFDGTGESDTIIQIGQGDTTGSIGAELAGAGVVASSKAFVKASEDNTKVLSLQPGYYMVKTKMSGAAAVSALTSPNARVGMLQVRAGTQLDDVNQPDGSVTPGVFSLLAKASCATLNGKSTCVSVDDLRKQAQTADLAAMGVPAWAQGAVSKNPDARRIEGLIAPGVYDVKPGWNAAQLLGSVLKTSATNIQAAGLVSSSTVEGKNPYEILIIASLIEREGVSQDFGKISRVTYNLLKQQPPRLRFDSTVNYLLDKPVITTSPEDRARPGPYNTYFIDGLPPTPIGSPSPEAIQAALEPTPGDWLFFVKCEKNGLSCFASTLQEHNQNVLLARQRGAY